MPSCLESIFDMLVMLIDVSAVDESCSLCPSTATLISVLWILTSLALALLSSCCCCDAWLLLEGLAEASQCGLLPKNKTRESKKAVEYLQACVVVF